MQHIIEFIKLGSSRLSNLTKGVITVVARLFGIKETKSKGYDSSQLASAVWIFALGIPAGLFIIGMNFPVPLWAAVVFGLLAIVNLDEALMLTAIYAEHGVHRKETVHG
jgi:hypothetical protein